MGSAELLGQMSIHVWPLPSSEVTLGCIYARLPRPLRRSGFETADHVGTVTGTSGSAAIVGTNTAFKQAHVGCVLRLSETSAEPTNAWHTNPFVEQATILSVTDANNLTLSANLGAAYTGVGYYISDPVELDPLMLNFLIRSCEYQLAIAQPASDKIILLREKLMTDAQIKAMEGDRKYFGPRDSMPRFVHETVSFEEA
jgi:hypothetical protein